MEHYSDRSQLVSQLIHRLGFPVDSQSLLFFNTSAVKAFHRSSAQRTNLNAIKPTHFPRYVILRLLATDDYLLDMLTTVSSLDKEEPLVVRLAIRYKVL
jgi:hypothetical protein